ncbi:MAG: methionine repressor-like protein [Defluviicoccus sp.]|nr:methionine repressor-like protein [Defluviicoccus sp.]MDE0274867.1 methionine repressor-like protein [Defluviicoccus sp.]
MTRWSLSIPEETDRTIRLFLARNGGKKGDLSRFVDEAVRRYVFDLTVEQVKDRNAEHDQDELLRLIDSEVDAARAARS